MSHTITEEMLNEQRKTTKKNVHYCALAEYKNKLLKLLEKEKKQAEKASQKLKEVLANNPSKAERTTANARCGTKWEYVKNLKDKIELLEELIEENK